MLENVALYYLGRYAASEASLRRVLNNRLRRAVMRNPDFGHDAEKQLQLRTAIETIVEKHKKSGVIDDAAYTEVKVRSLRRTGRSRRAIQQMLGQKGIKRDIIQQALVQNETDIDPEEVELKAALAHARRRRLGPFRAKPGDDDRCRKDIAALARAGFSINIARQIMRWTKEN